MKAVMLALFLTFGATGAGIACTTGELKPIPTEDMKTLRDVLVDKSADPFDQFAAYDRLSCSDSASVRALAIKYGFESPSQDLREHVMFDAMMQKELIDIVVDPDAKGYAQHLDNSNVVHLRVGARSLPEGCISFWGYSENCAENRMKVSISGSRVDVVLNDGFATFQLSDDNRLIGTIDAYSVGPAAAYIELF
jgi:hypothetical protein